ncbi:hypothetical protein [Paenibacillus popilliae]|nr:hypothetical protein [Paenibacillus sp. SDF0028]
MGKTGRTNNRYTVFSSQYINVYLLGWLMDLIRLAEIASSFK